jgi:hypothetical protein
MSGVLMATLLALPGFTTGILTVASTTHVGGAHRLLQPSAPTRTVERAATTRFSGADCAASASGRRSPG